MKGSTIEKVLIPPTISGGPSSEVNKNEQFVQFVQFVYATGPKSFWSRIKIATILRGIHLNSWKWWKLRHVKRFNVASSRFRPLCDKCTKLLDISTKTRCLAFYLRILFDNFKTFLKKLQIGKKDVVLQSMNCFNISCSKLTYHFFDIVHTV